MRITVDIDEKALARVKKYSHLKKVSPAVKFVIEDWLRAKDREAALDFVMKGGIDFPMTNDELEQKLYGLD